MTAEYSPTFHRCPHDTENPYAQVSRSLIRDNSISPECRWLIIYLLANRDDWKINIKQIINHCDGFMGKNRVYDVVKEAIKAGYIKAENYFVKGLKRIRYLVSEFPKFKDFLQLPEKPDLVKPDTVDSDSKEEASLKKKQVKNSNAAPSKEEALSKFIHEKIKSRKNDFTGKVIPKWHKDCRSLLKVRTEEEIQKAMEWAVNDSFWQSIVMSPGGLLKNLDKIEAQMNAKKQNCSLKDKEIYQRNRKYAQFLQEKYQGNEVDFCADYVGFKLGPNNYLVIKHSDFNFEDQIQYTFRKLGIFSVPNII